MILVLLGVLLFSLARSSGDLSLPQVRTALIQDQLGGVVEDRTRRDSAQAIADRMVSEVHIARSAVEALARRMRVLDVAHELDEAAYRRALEAARQSIDASEMHLLELRMDLRGCMTAAEWKELMSRVGRPEE